MRQRLTTTPETSDRMKRIGQSNTELELRVRQFLTNQGVRYRTCVKTLPGRPDRRLKLNPDPR